MGGGEGRKVCVSDALVVETMALGEGLLDFGV